MQTLTAVTPKAESLPRELALLTAPVRVASGERVGRAGGVLLEEDGGLLAFIVQLSDTLVRGAPWTLVPASGVTITDDSVLLLACSREALLAQPHTFEESQRRTSTAEDHPSDGAVAVPGPEAGGSMNPSEALKEGVEGGVAGAALGALAGLAVGGPITAMLAAFFATGGALLGVLSGVAQQRSGDAEDAPRGSTSTSDAARAALGRFAAKLHDPELSSSGLVETQTFTPGVAPPASRAQRPSTPASP